MSSQKLGASSKMLEIDLNTTAPPFGFETAFLAAYPNTGVRTFVSRAILALDGPGTLVVEDCEGHEVTMTLEDREVREFEAVGVVSFSGVSRIAVFL
jgi:hypothetical protein